MQQYLTCRVPSKSLLQGISLLRGKALISVQGCYCQDVSDASLFVSTICL